MQQKSLFEGCRISFPQFYLTTFKGNVTVFQLGFISSKNITFEGKIFNTLKEFYDYIVQESTIVRTEEVTIDDVKYTFTM